MQERIARALIARGVGAVSILGDILAGNGGLMPADFSMVVGFIGLLCWFAIAITQRMHIQTMTVLPVSMSVVYGGVGFGCLLMLLRALQRWWQAMRRGWRPDPNRSEMTID